MTRRAVLLRRVRVSARARRQGLHCHGRVGFQPEPELDRQDSKVKDRRARWIYKRQPLMLLLQAKVWHVLRAQSRYLYVWRHRPA